MIKNVINEFYIEDMILEKLELLKSNDSNYDIIYLPVIVGKTKDNKISEIHHISDTEIIGKEYLHGGDTMTRYMDSIDYKKWLESAAEDLAAAGASHYFENYKTACIQSYQAFEKGLKAYYIYRNSRVPETHNLSRLIDLCQSLNDKFEYYAGANKLYDEYYLQIKYPTNKTPHISESHAMLLLNEAAKLCGFVEERINEDKESKSNKKGNLAKST